MTTAYWWRGSEKHPVRNVGDELTPLLLKRFANIDVVHAPVTTADMIAVGSIIDLLPDDGSFEGFVVGSGKLREHVDVPARLRNAKVRALRGPLSAKGVPGSYALGDTGLLANELVTVDKEYNLGILAHWTDKRTWGQFKQWSPRIIDATADPLEVVAEIGRCRKLVTSSLHGVIIADAFGIPRRLEYTPTMDREGGQFKFRDFFQSVGMPLEFGKTGSPSPRVVETRQHELFDMLDALGDELCATL